MRILFLADINSAHTRKWVSGVASLGFETGIFSLSEPENDWYSAFGIKLLNENFTAEKKTYHQSDISKMKYLKAFRSIKKVVRSFNPDIIHSHYATSYGVLGALSGFHPYILSVWGSDVFDFPNRSYFHKLFLKRNFKKADLILSTSEVMRTEIQKFTDKVVEVTPFGIDTNVFFKTKVEKNDGFTIGIIKTMEKIYGIDLLIRSFQKVIQKYHSKKINLLIVGEGSQLMEYKNLVASLGIEDKVLFTGKVKQEDVPAMHNKIDLFVCPSINESFGVSVLEASACEVPVIVTKVGGLPEVVQDNRTGLILNSHNQDELADAISYFIDNPEKAIEFGRNGREFVKENYDWKENLVLISDIYKRFRKFEN